MLVHPRVPPVVRSLPHVESLALLREEESQEEAEVRKTLGLTITSIEPVRDSIIEGATMSPPTTNNKNNNMPENHDIIDTIQDHDTLDLAPEQLINSSQQAQSTVPVPPLEPKSPKLVASTSPLFDNSAPGLVRSVSAEKDEEMPAINMDSDSDVDDLDSME